MPTLNVPQEEWIPVETVKANKDLWAYEVAICRLDFWYWALRWVWTKDGNHAPSKRPFPDKEYMRVIFAIIENDVEALEKYNIPQHILDKIKTSKRTAIRKARRMIMTWLQLTRILWKCWFNFDQAHAIQSKKKTDSEGLLGKRSLDFMAYTLQEMDPLFSHELGVPVVLTDIIAFPNGSWVRAIPSGPEHLKQWTITEWDGDEAAKHNFLAEALGASIPTLEGGGRCLLWSSVKPGDFDEICNDHIGGKGDTKPETEKIEAFHILGCEKCGGLTVQVNPWNGFVVITLGYASDPGKDPCTEEGKMWYDAAREGIPEDEWNQEYEIDARAKAATLIIGTFSRDIHVKDFDIDPSWTHYNLLDIGIDAPTAALWVGVDKNLDLFVYDEYYFRNRTISQNAEAICTYEDLHKKMWKVERPTLRFIDPSAFNRDFNGTCPAYDYAKMGPHQLIYAPGNNDVDSSIEVLREYFRNTILGTHPAIYFKPHLRYTFYELRRWIFEKTGKPRKKHDHLMAGLRYLVMAPAIYIDLEVQSEWVAVRNELTGYVDYFQRDVETNIYDRVNDHDK